MQITMDKEYNDASADHERGNWNHRIVLDTDGEASVCVRSGHGNTMTADIYHGRTIYLANIHDGVADTTPIREYLESELVQAMLADIVEGYDTEWNGNNHVGTLTDHANGLIDDIDQYISDIVCPTYEGADDFLCHGDDDQRVNSESTDVELDIMADDIVAECRLNDAHLDTTDVRRWLDQIRDEKRENQD